MSVKVGGGTFYNLEEQVQVNKDDISNIKAKDTTQDASITALEQFKTKCDGAFEIEDDSSVSFGHDVTADGSIESGTDVTVGRNLYIDDLAKLQDPNGNQLVKQATSAQIGLCRPDGSTIFIDGNGKLYTSGGGGGTQLYKHTIVSGNNTFIIVNNVSTAYTTTAGVAADFRAGKHMFCYYIGKPNPDYSSDLHCNFFFGEISGYTGNVQVHLYYPTETTSHLVMTFGITSDTVTSL